MATQNILSTSLSGLTLLTAAACCSIALAGCANTSPKTKEVVATVRAPNEPVQKAGSAKAAAGPVQELEHGNAPSPAADLDKEFEHGNAPSPAAKPAREVGLANTPSSSKSSETPAWFGAAATLPAMPPDPHRVKIDGMNLAEAVGVAISRHPDIIRANAVIAQSSSEVAVAKAAWYPNVEYGLRPGYGQAYGLNDSQSGLSGSIGATQLVYDFNRTPSQISAAKATLSQQRYLFNDTVDTVAYDAANTFVELAASQDAIVAARQQVGALQDIHVKIEQRVKGGLSNASDLNQADVAIQRAEADVLTATTRFDVAVGKLAELIGVRPQRVTNLQETQRFVAGLDGKQGSVKAPRSRSAATANMRVADQVTVKDRFGVDNDGFDEPSAGASAAKAEASFMDTSDFETSLGGSSGDVENAPSVLAAKAATEASEAKVAGAKSGYWPSLSLGASKSASTTPDNAGDNSFVGVIIGGDYSLGGLVKHKVAAAEAEKRAAVQTLENQRLLTRTALGSAETEATGAAARLNSYERVIELTRRSCDLYWQEYTLNDRPLTDVINAEREIYQAEVERTNAVADQVLAQIKAYTAVGQFTKFLRASAGGQQ